MALESGADISVVSNMLGHTEITTAYKHYLKPRESMYIKTQQGVASIVPLGKISRKNRRGEKCESLISMVTN